MSFRTLALVSVLSAVCITAPANGVATLEFKGVVEEVPDNLSEYFSPGMEISGRYMVDPEADPNRVLVGLEVSIGDFHYTQSILAGDILAIDKTRGTSTLFDPLFPGGAADKYIMTTLVEQHDVTAALDGLFAFQFSDPDGSGLEPGFQITSPVDVSEFTDPKWTLDINIVNRVQGRVTDIWAVPTVPEPATGGVVALALLPLLVRGFRRNR